MQNVSETEFFSVFAFLVSVFGFRFRFREIGPRYCLHFAVIAFLQALNDLGGLLLSENLADFVVEVGGVAFKTHKAILAARCPYFAALLKPHTKEFQSSRVRLDNLSSEVCGEWTLC